MTNYDHHFVNNPTSVNESQFDICNAMDELIEIARSPNADPYDLGEAAGWIVQNYVELRKDRDALLEKIKRLESACRMWQNVANY